MQSSLGAIEILSILTSDSEMGAAAMKYAKPEVRKRLNLLARGIVAESAGCAPCLSVRTTPLGVKESYLNFEP